MVEELRVASLRDGKLFDLEIEIANANRNKIFITLKF